MFNFFKCSIAFKIDRGVLLDLSILNSNAMNLALHHAASLLLGTEMDNVPVDRISISGKKTKVPSHGGNRDDFSIAEEILQG